MEALSIRPVTVIPEQHTPVIETVYSSVSTDKPFIQANTIECSLQEIKDGHIIPVFVKDNEPCISIAEFIEAAHDSVASVFSGETIYKPSIRLSHPIKGRTPDARDIPANQLQEWQKTLYYERAAFVIEVPSIQSEVDGNLLSLSIVGVKAYNNDNLYNRKGVDEHFKVAIGFQNKVCCNTCIWSDGYMSNIAVKNIGQLRAVMQTLFQNYNANHHLFHLRKLSEYELTESQFALLMGRCRLYNHIPNSMKQSIQPLLFGDTQLGTVAKDYYRDESFCRSEDGNINLWRLFNLFTGTNKSTYIDSFLDRSVNAYQFAEQLRWALENKAYSWYLN